MAFVQPGIIFLEISAQALCSIKSTVLDKYNCTGKLLTTTKFMLSNFKIELTLCYKSENR